MRLARQLWSRSSGTFRRRVTMQRWSSCSLRQLTHHVLGTLHVTLPSRVHRITTLELSPYISTEYVLQSLFLVIHYRNIGFGLFMSFGPLIIKYRSSSRLNLSTMANDPNQSKCSTGRQGFDAVQRKKGKTAVMSGASVFANIRKELKQKRLPHIPSTPYRTH